MKRTLKILAYSFLSLALIVILAVAALLFLINPNDFKGTISQRVADQIGRPLSIGGDISWSFYPWLGFSLTDARIGNPKGDFTTPYFLSARHAHIALKLLPLLDHQLDIGQVKLVDATLNLERKADGHSNWHIAMNDSSSHATNDAQTTNRSYLDNANIEAIDIINGTVSYSDQSRNQNLTLSNVQLNADHIKMDHAFPLRLAFRIHDMALPLSAEVSYHTQLTVAPAGVSIAAKDSELGIQLMQLPDSLKSQLKTPINIRLSGPIAYDLKRHTLNLTPWKLLLNQQSLQGELQLTDLAQQPRIQASLATQQFNLVQLLASLGYPLPSNDTTQKLSDSSFSANINGVLGQSLAIQPLHLSLGDTKLNASAEYTAPNKISFTGDINKLDLATLLAPLALAPATQPTPGSDQNSDKLNSLRQSIANLQLDGSLNISQLSYQKLSADNFKLALAVNKQILSIKPISANFYGGTISAAVVLDTKANPNTLSVNQTIQGVSLGPLMNLTAIEAGFISPDTAAFLRSLPVTGTATSVLQLNSQGNTQQAITQGLNGSLDISVTGGSVEKLNVEHVIALGMAFLSKQGEPAQIGPNQTDFSKLSGRFNLKQGIVSNDDLTLIAPLLKVTGAGQVDLTKQQVDYQFTATRMTSNGDSDHKVNPQDSIPFLLSGPLQSPKLALDTKRLLQFQLKQHQETITKKVSQHLEKTLGDKLKQHLKLDQLLP